MIKKKTTFVISLMISACFFEKNKDSEKDVSIKTTNDLEQTQTRDREKSRILLHLVEASDLNKIEIKDNKIKVMFNSSSLLLNDNYQEIVDDESDISPKDLVQMVAFYPCEKHKSFPEKLKLYTKGCNADALDTLLEILDLKATDVGLALEEEGKKSKKGWFNLLYNFQNNSIVNPPKTKEDIVNESKKLLRKTQGPNLSLTRRKELFNEFIGLSSTEMVRFSTSEITTLLKKLDKDLEGLDTENLEGLLTIEMQIKLIAGAENELKLSLTEYSGAYGSSLQPWGRSRLKDKIEDWRRNIRKNKIENKKRYQRIQQHLKDKKKSSSQLEVQTKIDASLQEIKQKKQMIHNKIKNFYQDSDTGPDDTRESHLRLIDLEKVFSSENWE